MTTEPVARGRRALITGIAGQDGGYLAEQLLADGYRVYGLVRAGASAERARAMPWLADTHLLEGDLRDGQAICRALDIAAPDEIYNLASFSAPARAWTDAEACADVNAMGPLRILEAVRARDATAAVRIVQASTSEMFGVAANPQDESTPLVPVSPYGAGKAFAHHLVAHYRRHLGMFVSAAILYNHESPRRGEEFVTRKITRAAARIKLGKQTTLELGSLEARRDWGYAPDYVRSMRLMANQASPNDFVIGTGETHSIGEFVDIAFGRVGLDPRSYVRIDAALAARGNPHGLTANASKARERLGWTPTLSFRDIAELMVDADLTREAALP
jgi:GDPmannose 4,6-dehydratase